MTTASVYTTPVSRGIIPHSEIKSGSDDPKVAEALQIAAKIRQVEALGQIFPSVQALRSRDQKPVGRSNSSRVANAKPPLSAVSRAAGKGPSAAVHLRPVPRLELAFLSATNAGRNALRGDSEASVIAALNQIEDRIGHRAMRKMGVALLCDLRRAAGEIADEKSALALGRRIYREALTCSEPQTGLWHYHAACQNSESLKALRECMSGRRLVLPFAFMDGRLSAADALADRGGRQSNVLFEIQGVSALSLRSPLPASQRDGECMLYTPHAVFEVTHISDHHVQQSRSPLTLIRLKEHLLALDDEKRTDAYRILSYK